MAELNILAIVVAGVASFVASVAWYMVFGSATARLQREWRGVEPSGRPPRPWELLILLVNGWVIAAVVAVIVNLADISGWAASAGLGLLLWVGFALTQWVGSVLGEQVPVRLAAIHAGDWLMHMLIIFDHRRDLALKEEE